MVEKLIDNYDDKRPSKFVKIDKNRCHIGQLVLTGESGEMIRDNVKWISLIPSGLPFT